SSSSWRRCARSATWPRSTSTARLAAACPSTRPPPHPPPPNRTPEPPTPMTTETNPQVTAPAAPASNGKRQRALKILLLVVVLAGAAWLAWYLLYARWHEDTDDAYAQGNVVSVVPQTAGTVVGIQADDGDRVEAGQVLVQLDPNDAQVAYDQAVANLAATVRQVRGYFGSADAAQAELRARQVAVE